VKRGQALVEFALALPAILAVMLFLGVAIYLAVQTFDFQAVSLRELAAGAASSRHAYGIAMVLSSPRAVQHVRPGQSLGETWTRWLQREAGSGWACLDVERGWMRHRSGPRCSFYTSRGPVPPPGGGPTPEPPRPPPWR